MTDISLCGYTTFCLSFNLLMDIWVGFFVVVIMNNAVVKIQACVFAWTHVFVSLGYIPRTGVAEPYDNCDFLRNG